IQTKFKSYSKKVAAANKKRKLVEENSVVNSPEASDTTTNIDEDNKQNIFKYKLCSKEYNSEHTIDALKKHFSRKHYYIWNQIKLLARQSFTTEQQSSQVVGQQSSQVVGQQSSQVVGQQSSQIVEQQSSQVVGQQSSQVVGQQSYQSIGQPIKNMIDIVKTNYKLKFEDAVFNFNTREISAKKIILEM
ncbi:26801_t:CDS:2, partial [Gigaspora margarita]